MRCIFVISFTLLLFACNEAPQQTSVQKAEVAHALVDSQSYFLQKTATLMGLIVPSEKDSFVLRLWITSMVKPDHVIELRKSRKYWEPRKFIYYYEPDERLMFKEVPLELLSTLEPMIDSLRQVDFTRLISQEQIQGFQDNVADGMTYNMEIFKSGQYKKLIYHCPETFYSREENNKRFVDILMLLNKHFIFYSPICKRG